MQCTVEYKFDDILVLSQCDMYNSTEYVLYFDYPFWIPPFANLTLAANLCQFNTGGFLLVLQAALQPTITIYSGYGTGRLTSDGIKVYTVKKELLETGKTTVINSFGHTIPIYNQERTICDLVRNRSQFEIQDYQTALKTYVSRKDKI